MNFDSIFYKQLLDDLYDGVYFIDRDLRITYWNRGAERITGYPAEEVMGSCCGHNILDHVNAEGTSLCLNGCPVSMTIADGSPREAQVFLHHKEGHRVPVQVRVSPIRDGEGAIIGAVEIFSENSTRLADLQRIEELEQLVFLDPLTGLANRRYIQMNLQSKIDEMFRYGWPFGVMLLDIDHFKQVNDRYGHDRGDNLLKMVSRTLQHAVRSYDQVGRWGGEEFIIILANVAGGKLAANAERFRRLVEQSTMSTATEIIRVTISIGATVATRNDTVETLLKRADELLYRSKAAGRNCVSCG